MHDINPNGVTATIDLPWWPPLDEPIGDARAAELVAALRQVVGPVVDDAERDLRSRLDPDTEVVRSGTSANYIARYQFSHSAQRFLCVGTVYQEQGNPAEMNSIQLDRAGVVGWRRE